MPEYFCSAVSNINLSSPTATVVSGAVRDTQIINSGQDGIYIATDPIASFSIQGSCIPPNGRYRLYLEFRWGGSGGSDNATVYAVVKRNGIALLPISYIPSSGPIGLNTPSWEEITDISVPSGNADWSYKNGPPCIPIVASDVLEVCIYTTPGAWTRFPEIIQSKLELIEAGASVGPVLPILTSDAFPIGATDLTDSPIHIGANLDVTDSDIVVTDNGDIFFAYNINNNGSNTEIIIRKYSGGTWTTFKSGADIFSHATRDSYSLGFATDGTDLWIAYGVEDATALPGYPSYNKASRIYCKKITAGGTVSSLGGSINSRVDPTYNQPMLNDGDLGSGVNLQISPAGVPWIGFCGINVTGYETQPFLFYWNGSSWIDSGLSKPVNPHPTGNGYTVAVIYNVVAYRQVQFTFCQHDGANEYPSAAYAVRYSWSNQAEQTYKYHEFYYQEYNGATWDNQIKFNFPQYWPNATALFHEVTHAYLGRAVNTGHWQIGLSLADDGTTVYFGAVLGYGPAQRDGTWVIKLKADGTDFERACEQSLEQMIMLSNRTTFQLASLSTGNMIAISDDFLHRTIFVMLLRDSGTNQGWTAASRDHNPVGYLGSGQIPVRLTTKNGSAYVLPHGYLNSFAYYDYLPWRLVGGDTWYPVGGAAITGVIGMTWKQGNRVL